MDPDELEEVFREKPALHRFPGQHGDARTQEFCAAIASEYGGDAARGVDGGAGDGADLERRLLALPGIGEMKARSLGGRAREAPRRRAAGWEEFAPQHRRLGDVDSPEALADVPGGRSAPARPRSRAAAQTA